MNKFFKFSALTLLTILVINVISSCKKKFDEPPVFQEPLITVTKTIAQIKALHVSNQIEAFTDDDVISGIVNADDKSGNYYKQISIQDETGGITIRLDGTNLYANYPIGRKIYIKLKGLFMGDYNGLVQLGGAEDYSGTFPNVLGIPSALFDTHIIKGSPGYPVPAKVVKISELNSSLQSMLIQIDGSEFASTDTSKTYADAVGKLSVNLNVKPCSGGTVIVRTSGYANFAGINVPNGNGPLKAIYTTFGSTKQLIVRDTSDVQFYGDRCSGGGGGPVAGTLINTADLRALYTGTTTTAPTGKKITGIVISNKNTLNINSRNIVLQQGNGLAGILVRFDGDHNFELGDSIDVSVSGQELSEFNGLLQLNNVPIGNAGKVSSGKSITPRATTVAGLLTNFEAWESTLIKFTGVDLTPAGTWAASSGNTTVTQSSSTITCFTLTAATFSGSTKPTGSVDMVAYVSQGGASATKQVSIRNTTDVTGGIVPPPPAGVLLDENFETVTTTGSTPVALTGWKNIGETGAIQYLGKTFSSNKYAQITAFNSTVANQKPVVKSWLITPPVNLNGTTTETLTFKTNDGFNNGATLKVYYSTNYTGDNTPSTATWTELTATISSGNTAGYGAAFTPSGNVNLSAINGTAVYIAFVYEGGYSPTVKTTTFQVDDVKIVGN
ncbi:DUF5689 domain-containing protein [Ferruginibacter lapsinanis]|uniref:DUF5689 domain-containing protein n=1 Tax=Ferruginibacter lapsinanis TaxID=563172 RepID=UPI001E5AAD44|nr:DUF5689 domain-containing protein [Ferruginibacter lapsinanis]UEG48578.1 DUF5689 domain-containing protein [Ferruginibacter lapsinanis]